ncbi:MAG TPA: VWA domain-containing protein [Thermoleophilaceae bacterium]|nr:VWA domain-containing protein [Thermoleophilaceae bacterium]
MKVTARLILVLLALLLVAPAAGADGGLRLTPVGKPRFPDRTYALTVPPGSEVDPNQVRVEENGRPVAGRSVSPASRAAEKLGVVLVIDASRSMTGQPIEDAMEAARTFARRRNPIQPMGVVMFNSEVTRPLPLTTDGDLINRALESTPTLKRETHVYDGVDAAVSMLAQEDLAGGSVIVMSDGADTGSTTKLSEAAAHARAEGIRVFSVGLQSSAFRPAPLQNLAADSRGRYSEAGNGADLAPIYDRLGAELSNEYLVQYRSLQDASTRVTVQVTVDGIGTATASYRSPAAAEGEVAPYDRNDFWRSPSAVVLVSLFAGGLAALALFMVFARPGRRRLTERLAMFVRTEDAPAEGEREQHALGLLPALERRLASIRGWSAFQEELDIARVKVPPAQIAAAAIVGTVFISWILASASGIPLLGLVGLIGVPVGIKAFVRTLADKQRRAFDEQLADNLQVIASAQRAGHSFLGAMTVSVQEAPEPTKREFDRVLADERLGISIEDALEGAARRMQSRDLEQVILVARLQRETGGNTAEVLDQVATTARERSELRRLIQTLTAQGRMSRWIITALPVSLLVLVSLLNPGYTEPLFETSGGRLALGIGAVLLVMGSLAIKRIVTIKV